MNTIFVDVKLSNGAIVRARVVRVLAICATYIGNDVWKGIDGYYYIVW